jgi:hypothetical protein
MAKPSMIIDLISRGPGDEEEDEESPLDDEEEEGEAARAADPEALIASIESQLAELRRSVAAL